MKLRVAALLWGDCERDASNPWWTVKFSRPSCRILVRPSSLLPLIHIMCYVPPPENIAAGADEWPVVGGLGS